MFECVSGNDFHNGDVSPCEETDEPHCADDEVLDGHQRRLTLCVEGRHLEHGREDERQEAAADRADQRDDEVQLWDQDGEGT